MTSQVITSQVLGNTNKNFRARAFLLTLNEISKFDFLLEQIDKLKSCDYYIAAKEIAPTTGHEHIHMYIHFESNYKLSKKILSTGVHVDISRGSPKQNIDYVKKDGNIICEKGSQPHQGKLTVAELKEMPDDEVPAQLYNIKKKISHDLSLDIDIDEWKKDVKIYYIYGPSASGKTERAKQIVRELDNHKVNIIKYENGFYNGVPSEINVPTAIYDDFRDSHMPASEFINLIDYNTHTMNIKGGFVKNSYSTIIITSVQSPYEIYKNMNDEPRKQWLRRMEIICLNDSVEIEKE